MDATAAVVVDAAPAAESTPAAPPTKDTPPPPPTAPSAPPIAPGNTTWEGATPTFMTSNEWRDRGRGGGGATWSTAGLTGPAATAVAGDASAPHWLGKLGVVKDVLADGATLDGKVPTSEAIGVATIYLALINSGALPCAEGGGHARPDRAARVSMLAFRMVEWFLSQPAGEGVPPAARALARRLHPRLPSFGAAYVASTPLTRVRDLAHRGDIPSTLKAEIKHTLQNKLHRNAGPEDLVATQTMLARLRAGDPAVPPSFLAEFELFTTELATFFGAADLDDQLAGLAPSLDADCAAVIDRVLATKAALAALDAGPPPAATTKAATKPPSSALSTDATRVLTNALADAAHAATGARALLTAGLESGMRNDTPDASLAMRQRWRVADARLEDWLFVLLSRLAAAVDAPSLATSPAVAWSVPLGSLLLAVRNIGIAGWSPRECFAIENELTTWRTAADADTRDGALRLKATLERALRLAQTVADGLAGALAPAAAALGEPLGASRVAAAVPEAEVRASIAFQVAKLAAALLDAARRVAGVPPWDAVVSGDAAGVLVCVPSLEAAPALLATRPDPTTPAIILARHATGDEEVGAAAGQGDAVAAVLVARGVPHLSHLGVRARQVRLPFAACPDAAIVDAAVSGLEGEWVRVCVRPDGVTVERAARPATASSPAGEQSLPPPLIPPPTAPDTSTTALVPLLSARVHTAGAKAASCGALLRAAGASRGAFGAACGCVLPFGALRAAAEGAGATAALDAAIKAVDAADDGAALDAACASLRGLVAGLCPDAGVLAAAVAATTDAAPLLAVRSSASAEDLAGASAAGLYDSVLGVRSADPEALGAAVAAVWASLFTRRAVLARRAAGASSAGDAAMAVILQAAAPAALSFVLHTRHPDRGGGWAAAEVAVGAGEALASAADGSPWRFALRLDASGDSAPSIVVDSYANLSHALLPPPPGSREAASGGAALVWRPVDYTTQRLSTDPDARARLGAALADVAASLETLFGGPQDVEGCVSGDGRVCVVQSRPQP